jgi:hypothetical protein
MNLRRLRSPRATGLLAGAAAPAILIVLAATDAGVSPESSHAASSVASAVEEGAPAAAVAVRPSVAQVRALEHSRRLLEAPIAGSPFRTPESANATALAPADADEPEQAAFEVSAIVNSPKGAIAVIEGKPRRVGDAVADGWSVAAIDPVALTVTLSRADGQATMLRMRRPTAR